MTPSIVDDATIERLRTVVAPLAADGRGGARNLLDVADVQALARSAPVRALARAVLGEDCFAVRALLFDRLRTEQSEVDCEVVQGGVLAFRPLILHASAPSTVPHHRRVIHLEFAIGELPPPLAWHRRIA